ncbi:YnbE family lipoprotein, partial [Proteus mirabilis]
EKPININMNVKIEHEINVKIDRQVEDLLKNNSAIF